MWDDTIIILQGDVEDTEEPIARSVTVVSSAKDVIDMKFGANIIMTAELHDFKETDVYEFQWYYSEDGKTFIPIEGANGATYEYVIDRSNCFNIWRIEVTIINDDIVNKE